MNILVIYFKWKNQKDRNTIDEHLYSFRNYVKGVQFHYFNGANGIPWYLTRAEYDGVILHYTFLGARWSRNFYSKWLNTISNLEKIPGYKVAIPQDEYAESVALCELFRKNGIRSVFTCFPSHDFEKVYPKEKTGLKHIITVFPGYVDEDAVKRIKVPGMNRKERPIDLGYRARKLPYWLGRHGQLKHEIGEVFLERARSSRLIMDISMGEKEVFFGEDWYRFLGRCRAVLGCEGGASLLDPKGEIRFKVEQYVRNHPNASFEEVEENCFPGKDYNINLFTLSPRHFECAITKTCQVLLEGNYGGILLPGIHYIEVKKDYSNIDEVIKKIGDVDYCTEIANNAFRDIIQSGKYTYRIFAKQVIDHIKCQVRSQGRRIGKGQQFLGCLGKYLSSREHFEPVLVKFFYLWLGLKLFKAGVFKRAFDKLKDGSIWC